MRWPFFRPKRQGREDLIAVLDIGSSRISCAIAEVDAPHPLHLIGMGHHSSHGIKNGVITNMEQLEMAVSKAVMHAEKTAGHTIKGVYLNVPSPHITSQGVDVEMSINGGEVTEADVAHLMKQACSSFSQANHEIIHAIPTNYYIDESRGIKDPRGMIGSVLGANIHIVTAALGPLRNLIACVERCHLSVNGVVAATFAAGLGVLDEDEIELGCTIIDIGASNTGIAVFCEGSLLHLNDIPIGGNLISKDLSRGLSTPLSHAERVKCLYGSAIMASTLERENIIIPIIGERSQTGGGQVSRSTLTRIIKPRVEELFEHIRDHLDKIGIEKIPGCRIVLTGGGSLMMGINEIAQSILNKSVRTGAPMHIAGLHDEHLVPYLATCMGMLSYARLQQNEILESDNKNSKATGFFNIISQWVHEKL